MKKILTWILPLVLAMAVAVTWWAWPGNIDRQAARDIALTHVGGGHANPAELDFENFTRVWSVEVFDDGLVHEVYVSRQTGDVIRVEISR